MEDITRAQIKESCKLALPEGLKDLMADISREVLRAQPLNLYQFIADYLSALLITREHLSIAARVCGDVCDNVCHPPLDAELLEIGLEEEDIAVAIKTVKEFFESGDGKEENLMLKLIRDTNISEYQLPSVVEVVREAYVRHKLKNTPPLEETPSGAMDDVTRAVKHTLDLYQKTGPSEHQKCVMAQKIQAAYRAYRIRRSLSTEQESKRRSFKSLASASARSIRFDSNIEYNPDYGEEHKLKNEYQEAVHELSSTSLAGSFLALHHTKPYSAIDHEHEFDETQQHVHTYDYTDDEDFNTQGNHARDDKKYNDDDKKYNHDDIKYNHDDIKYNNDNKKAYEENCKKKQISWHSMNEVIDAATFADDDSVSSIPDECPQYPDSDGTPNLTGTPDGINRKVLKVTDSDHYVM